MNTAKPSIINYYKLVIVGLLVLLTTFLRVSLLVLSPLIVFFLIYDLKFNIRTSLINLLFVIAISYIISLFNGGYFKYNLLSFFYVIPFLFLLFTKPQKKDLFPNLFDFFILVLTFITFISNIIGFIQYINFPNDDSFAGLYGRFTVTQNGLSIINALLFYYYLKKYFISNNLFHFVLSFIFGLSFIMGFYGGGVMAVIATFFIQSLEMKPSRILQTVILSLLVILVVGSSIYLVRPQTLRYNLNIINRFSGKTNEPAPRKLLSYRNYYIAYKENTRDLLFGSGPGTFNSRSAFVIGSPDYFKPAASLKSSVQPYYFKNFAYTLWNANNTGKWKDGFMNQPFSSLLAFLGEYGLIFTSLFFIYYIRQHRTVMKYAIYDEEKKLIKDTYNFISILLIFLLIIDNYAEYPEISILMILLMKLAERELGRTVLKPEIK